MPSLEILLPVLFLTGLVAGLVDSIAGGGGLITLPVLLAVGIPPQMVLGTNKFQSTFGSFTATRHYVKKDVVDLRDVIPGVIATGIGAALGAYAVQQIDAHILNQAIPVLLLVIAVYTIVSPRFGHLDAHARMKRMPFYVTLGLGLGFYDGFFGPGAGAFWAMAFVLLLGMNLMRATGYTKVMNFTSNIVSLAVFLIGGNVMFTAGLVMGAGQIVGSRLGAGLAVKRGVTFIRPIFITVVIALAAKLIYSRWF